MVPFTVISTVYGALTTPDLHKEVTPLLQYSSAIIPAHTPHSYTHTLRIPVRKSPAEEVVSNGHLKFKGL